MTNGTRPGRVRASRFAHAFAGSGGLRLTGFSWRRLGGRTFRGRRLESRTSASIIASPARSARPGTIGTSPRRTSRDECIRRRRARGRGSARRHLGRVEATDLANLVEAAIRGDDDVDAFPEACRHVDQVAGAERRIGIHQWGTRRMTPCVMGAPARTHPCTWRAIAAPVRAAVGQEPVQRSPARPPPRCVASRSHPRRPGAGSRRHGSRSGMVRPARVHEHRRIEEDGHGSPIAPRRISAFITSQSSTGAASGQETLDGACRSAVPAVRIDSSRITACRGASRDAFHRYAAIDRRSSHQ